MKKKCLLAAGIWFAVTLTWLIVLIAGTYNQESIGMFVLRGFCVLFSLIVALLNLIAYRNQNKKN